MRKALTSLIAVSVCGLFLSGCGGGGESALEPDADPQGFWASPDEAAAFVITAGKEVWGLEVIDDKIYAYRGDLTVSGTRWTASNMFIYDDRGQRAAMTGQGSFTPKLKLTGQVSVASRAPQDVELLYSPQGYDTPPKLSDLAGHYQLITSVSAAAGDVSIDSAGSFSGSERGCGFTGKATPDASGKGFYRITVTFAASSNCLRPGQTVGGVLVHEGNAGVVVMASDDRTFGLAVMMVRT